MSNTEALALFIGGPMDGKRERVPAHHDHYQERGFIYEAWDIPAPPERGPVRVFAPVGSSKEDVFWTLLVGFDAERAVACAHRPWDKGPPARYEARRNTYIDPPRIRPHEIEQLMRAAGFLKD